MVLAIWLLLFGVCVFGPMRWSLIALLCLSTIDFQGGRGSFASFNVVKGVLLPVYLLWRLRAYSGHRITRVAPVAWLLLIAYIGIAAFWSLFPQSAGKLVGEMLGSLLVAFVYIRATKSGALTATSAIPATIGCLALATLRGVFFPIWADAPGRFTSFLPAQAFAALLAGLYCVVLCGKGIRTEIRVLVCSALAVSVVLNGSRIWFAGILLATFFALMLSEGQVWLKICSSGALLAFLAVLSSGTSLLFGLVAEGASTNRIASIVTAIHRNDANSSGLGTFNFRREVNEVAIQRIKQSTPEELIFGRGTCNGAVITGSLFAGYSKFGDPNRMFHNEWLRVIYEWGVIGSVFWLLFIGSIITFAIQGVRFNKHGNAKPLLIYLPSFMVALAGENILAGAANAVNMGFIFVLALATIPHREYFRKKALHAASWAAFRNSMRRPPARPLRTGWAGPEPSQSGL